MSDFTLAIPVILNHEGGSAFTDDPNDPGGATKYGISLLFLSDHLADGDINHDGVVDVKDIQAMSETQAIFLYKKFWWDRNNYNAIQSQTIATKVFDTAVNMGSIPANKILQRAVNNVTGTKLVVDGAIGPSSLTAINNTPVEKKLLVVLDFCNQQWAYYQQLIARNAKLAKYANGWKNRAYDI